MEYGMEMMATELSTELLVIPDYDEKEIILVKEYVILVPANKDIERVTGKKWAEYERHRPRLCFSMFGGIISRLKIQNLFWKYYKSPGDGLKFEAIVTQLPEKERQIVDNKFISRGLTYIDPSTILNMPEIISMSLKKFKRLVWELEHMTPFRITIMYMKIREPVVSYLEQKELTSLENINWLKNLFDISPNSCKDFDDYIDKMTKHMISTSHPESLEALRQDCERRRQDKIKEWYK